MRVLVFGSNGQVASELRERVGANPDFLFLRKEEIPVGDQAAIAKIVEGHHAAAMINCAAYTAVDKAESDREACALLNSKFVSDLVGVANVAKAHLIHFSTDYVFDGEATRPYVETDATSPVNFYGSTKLAGEQAVLTGADAGTVIRTSWVYSKYGANFVKTMIRLSNGEKPLKVVDDQVGCPTAAADLAEFVLQSALTRKADAQGPELYHFSGGGETSWNGFAREIAKLWQTRQRDIVRISSIEFPTPAARPKYGVLSKAKAEHDFNIVVQDWRQSLRQQFEHWGDS